MNLVQMHGQVRLGGPEGFIFHGVTVDSADLDFPTIRLAVPAAILEGRARGSGTLEVPGRTRPSTGTWSQNDLDRPASMMQGRIRVNTRDTIVALDADLNFLPLDFEGCPPCVPHAHVDRRPARAGASRGTARPHVRARRCAGRARQGEGRRVS